VTSLDAFIKAGALDASEIGRMAKAVRANRNRKVSLEKFNATAPRMLEYDYVPFMQQMHGIFATTETSPKDWCVVGIEANTYWTMFFHEYRQAPLARIPDPNRTLTTLSGAGQLVTLYIPPAPLSLSL